MHLLRFVLALFATLLVCGNAHAQDQRLAVLELQGGLDPQVLLLLSDEVRAGALHVLADHAAYSVRTRENTIALLQDMGLDPAECTADANCEVDAGRMIGASLVASGMLVEVEGSLNLTLKLFHADSANLLATQRVSATTQMGLRSNLFPRPPLQQPPVRAQPKRQWAERPTTQRPSIAPGAGWR